VYLPAANLWFRRTILAPLLFLGIFSFSLCGSAGRWFSRVQPPLSDCGEGFPPLQDYFLSLACPFWITRQKP
jgi:hypothetical protein